MLCYVTIKLCKILGKILVSLKLCTILKGKLESLHVAMSSCKHFLQIIFGVSEKAKDLFEWLE
jgi:hypothetical protein